jgi:choline dehydrogenase-like flavoprotein
MGPGVDGFVKDLVGKPRTLDDGRPGGFYVPALPQPKDKQKDFVAATASRQRRHRHVPRRLARARLWRRLQEVGPRIRGGDRRHGGFGEVLSRYENAVSIDPEVKDKWGVPVLRFDFKFGDNEKKMAADMADTAKEIFEEAGIEVVDHDRHILTEGWSDPRAGHRAHGQRPQDLGLTQHQQSHDVKNLFVVDGSSHCERVLPEPDLDDHGPGLAVV